MILQPFPFLTTLSAEELPSYECSDRIMLPKTFYEAMGYAPNDLLTLTNKRNQYITGTLFGTQETKQEYIHKVSSNYYASIVKIETISDKINILSQKLNKSENDRIIEEKLHSEYIYYKNTVIVLKKPEIVFFS